MSIFDRILRKTQKKTKQKCTESPADNPAVLLGRQLADSLREKIPDTAALPEIVTYFEEICRIPLENVKIDDDLLLYETGVFGFSGSDEIHFSLTRQFPDGEGEYVQVQVFAHYPDREGSIQLQDTMWSDWVDDKAQFFDYVRRSAAYTALADTLPMAVDITCDQT